MTPRPVSYGAKLKVWWKCADCDHEWEAWIYNRTKGSGCPKCAQVVKAQKAAQRAAGKRKSSPATPEPVPDPASRSPALPKVSFLDRYPEAAGVAPNQKRGAHSGRCWPREQSESLVAMSGMWS
jgi:hypothetical protein